MKKGNLIQAGFLGMNFNPDNNKGNLVDTPTNNKRYPKAFADYYYNTRSMANQKQNTEGAYMFTGNEKDFDFRGNEGKDYIQSAYGDGTVQNVNDRLNAQGGYAVSFKKPAGYFEPSQLLSNKIMANRSKAKVSFGDGNSNFYIKTNQCDSGLCSKYNPKGNYIGEAAIPASGSKDYLLNTYTPLGNRYNKNNPHADMNSGSFTNKKNIDWNKVEEYNNKNGYGDFYGD